VIERALSNSRNGKPFTDSDLLSAVPSQRLVDYVPLSFLWESVIRPKVAERNGLMGGPQDSGQADTTAATHRVEGELIGTSAAANAYDPGNGGATAGEQVGIQQAQY
jgi:hypothetical protein